MTKLSIIVLNYNSGDYLINCLNSIKQVENEVAVKTIVIDNASSDGSIEKAKEKFPLFEYILNNKNLGFAAGNNIGLRQVETEYALLLNPDTQLEKGVVSFLLKFMDDNPVVGASSCKIVLPNGQVDLTAHRAFPTPLASLLYFFGNNSLYHLTDRDFDSIHEVDAITGAFFLTRMSILKKLDFFDEDYFLYGEDLDLCYRIKQLGFKIMYIPGVKILHNKGVSSGIKKHSQALSSADIATKKRSLDSFYQTMKIFYKKHYEKKYPTVLNLLIYLGINLKWFLAKRRLTV